MSNKLIAGLIWIVGLLILVLTVAHLRGAFTLVLKGNTAYANTAGSLHLASEELEKTQVAMQLLQTLKPDAAIDVTTLTRSLPEGNPLLDAWAAGTTEWRLGPNATLLDKDGNVVGTIDSKGNIISSDGQILGRLGPNGTILGPDGQLLGKLATGTQIVDAQGRVVATIGENGKVIAADGRVLGTLTEGGKIVDDSGKVVAIMGADGQIQMVDESGKVLGVLGADGLIRTSDGRVLTTDGKEVEHLNPENYEVTLIYFSKDVRKAVVNGEVVRQGDRLPGGETIQKINKETVVLGKNEQKVTVKVKNALQEMILGEQQAKKPSQAGSKEVKASAPESQPDEKSRSTGSANPTAEIKKRKTLEEVREEAHAVFRKANQQSVKKE